MPGTGLFDGFNVDAGFLIDPYVGWCSKPFDQEEPKGLFPESVEGSGALEGPAAQGEKFAHQRIFRLLVVD